MALERRECAGVFQRKTPLGDFVPPGMSPGTVVRVKLRRYEDNSVYVRCKNLGSAGHCCATVPVVADDEIVRGFVYARLCPFLEL